MSRKEIAYNIIDYLSEEQLAAFITLFGNYADIPNAETEAAMLEADRIANDPDVKGYTDLDEMMRDLMS